MLFSGHIWDRFQSLINRRDKSAYQQPDIYDSLAELWNLNLPRLPEAEQSQDPEHYYALMLRKLWGQYYDDIVDILYVHVNQLPPNKIKIYTYKKSIHVPDLSLVLKKDDLGFRVEWIDEFGKHHRQMTTLDPLKQLLKGRLRTDIAKFENRIKIAPTVSEYNRDIDFRADLKPKSKLAYYSRRMILALISILGLTCLGLMVVIANRLAL